MADVAAVLKAYRVVMPSGADALFTEEEDATRFAAMSGGLVYEVPQGSPLHGQAALLHAMERLREAVLRQCAPGPPAVPGFATVRADPWRIEPEDVQDALYLAANEGRTLVSETLPSGATTPDAPMAARDGGLEAAEGAE